MIKKVGTNFSVLIALIFFSTFAALIHFKPLYNWDMLPYCALVLQSSGVEDERELHEQTYLEIEKLVPEYAYTNFTDSNHHYRREVSRNAEYFIKQLPFYKIKPLFIYTSLIFYYLGFDLERSVRIPSQISFVLIALLLFHVCSKRLPIFGSLALSIGFMVLPPWINTLRIVSPDLLACAFGLLAFYFLIEKGFKVLFVVFAILSILSRPDMLVVMCGLAGLYWYFDKKTIFSFSWLLVTLTLLFGTFKGVTIFAGAYPWKTLLIHSYIHLQLDPSRPDQDIGFFDYLSVLSRRLDVLISWVHVLFVVTFPIFAGFSLKNLKIYQLTWLMLLIAGLAKFLYFPGYEERLHLFTLGALFIVWVNSLNNYMRPNVS